MRIDDKLASSASGTSAAAPTSTPAGREPAPGAGFGQALAQARQTPSEAAPTRAVVSGDTLVGVVREQAQQRGVALSAGQTLRQARQLARDSGIANPDRIFPGQQLSLGKLHAQFDGGLGQQPTAVLAGAPSTAAVIAAFQAPDTKAVRVLPTINTPSNNAAVPSAGETADVALSASKGQAHPVLEQTLDRAVAKGFIPAIERGDVYDKILQLASNHRFKPDDFARMTLMESDGMNPQATNQRCHGIIQFCDGSDRGAATAGFAANPRAILGFSVYQQLHLVDKYFSEVGVKAQAGPQGTAKLDDLYLSVLMPSARNTTAANAPLNIGGSQASYLHVGRDRSGPITRQSILEGLQQNAAERLAPFASPRSRLQALRLSGYEDGAPNPVVNPAPSRLR